MKVLLRNGDIQDYDVSKIIDRIKNLKDIDSFDTKYLKDFDFTDILKEFEKNVYNVNRIMTSYDIDNELCMILLNKFTIIKNSNRILKLLYISNFLKNIKKLKKGTEGPDRKQSEEYNFEDFYFSNKNIIKKEYHCFIESNMKILNDLVLSKNNYIFDYIGFKVMEDKYLLRNDSNIIIETPIILFMRVSIQLCNYNIDFLTELFENITNFNIMFSTPILYNSLIKDNNQLASCYLQTIQSDSFDNIFRHIKCAGNIAGKSGGNGINITNAIANHDMHNIIPFFDLIRQKITQKNKRNGSIALYLDVWSKDVEKFIYLKSTHNSVNYQDLFFGLMINDVFMERVSKNSTWSLFNPKDVPMLYDKESFGNKFTELYEKYEKDQSIPRKIVNAFELFNDIGNAKLLSGTPYIIFSDRCNEYSNENHIGIIRCSNLCTEIMEVSDDNRVAVCILGSLGLNNMWKTGDSQSPEGPRKRVIDYKKIKYCTNLLTKALNNMIDVCEYADTLDTKTRSKEHEFLKTRSIGIGVRGLGDLFINLGLPFEDKKSFENNKKIFEHIYFSALETSCELSKLDKPYPLFEGSQVHRGILHIDHFKNQTKIESDNWNNLRNNIKVYGIRNSLLVALMPTATTAQITNTSESFEPPQLIYSKQLLNGNFTYIHPKLYEIISDKNWNYCIEKIIKNNGSVQNLSSRYMSVENKKLLKNVYEISQSNLVEMSIQRAPYIDQSQSLNLYSNDSNIMDFLGWMFKAWKGGLKTGNYYLRIKPGYDPIQYSNCTEDCESCTA